MPSSSACRVSLIHQFVVAVDQRSGDGLHLGSGLSEQIDDPLALVGPLDELVDFLPDEFVTDVCSVPP